MVRSASASVRSSGREGPGARVQQLHLVGFTTDLDQLILSVRKGAKSGSYLVPLDDRLLAEIAEAVRRRNDDQTTGAAPPLELPPEVAAAARPPSGRARPASSLTGREIQARLRSGRSIAEVAKEAGADEEWVTKFASPVIAERAQIIRAARQLVFSKPRRGPSAEPLGSSVRWNLADRGVRMTDDEFDACWDAYLVGDSLWGVTFDAVTRGRQHHAVWEVDLREGEVFARNRAASDFGFVETARRRNPPSLAAESKPARTQPQPQPARSGGAKTTARSAKGGARTSGRAASARGTKSAARTTKRQPGKRSGGRGAPPVSAAPSGPAPATAATPAPVPNELAKHRLRLVQSERVNERPAMVRSRPRPQPQAQLGSPRVASPAQAPSSASSPPPAAPRPAGAGSPPVAAPPSAPPDPALDVEPEVTASSDEDAARRRREERRRARAAARQANGSTGGDRDERRDVDRGSDTTTFEPQRADAPRRALKPAAPPAPAPSSASTPAPPPENAPEQGRVVTIRASRAGSAAAGDGRNAPGSQQQQQQQRGDVIVRGGTPALRPARPAVKPVQPRRRRFGRSR